MACEMADQEPTRPGISPEVVGQEECRRAMPWGHSWACRMSSLADRLQQPSQPGLLRDNSQRCWCWQCPGGWMRSTGDNDFQSQMRWARCLKRQIDKTWSMHCWSCCIAWCLVRDKRARFVEAATSPLRRGRRREGRRSRKRLEMRSRCREQECRLCSWPPTLMQLRATAPAGVLRSTVWRCTATAACVPTCAPIVSPKFRAA